MNKETCNILIQTLDVTLASLANIQSELRSINTDNDGKEKSAHNITRKDSRARNYYQATKGRARIGERGNEIIIRKEC